MSCDSDAVLALKAKLRGPIFNDGSDWAKVNRKRVQRDIRNQRLLEARMHGTHTEEQWLALLAHFDYRCVRCGCTPVGRPCKDHIRPIYIGGSDGLDNLQPLCRECNTAKGPDAFNWAAYRDEHGFESDVDA